MLAIKTKEAKVTRFLLPFLFLRYLPTDYVEIFICNKVCTETAWLVINSLVLSDRMGF